jgi:hypothetical protein
MLTVTPSALLTFFFYSLMLLLKILQNQGLRHIFVSGK